MSAKWLRGIVAMMLALGLVVLGAAQSWAQEPAKPAEKKEEKKEEKKPPLPMKPERTVEFTTDEGTWISLDVSPDGKSIVFELLGDLYTLPIEGGEAKKLPVSDTSHKDGWGMAFDSEPRYSPDGKWIAFVSDRDGSDNLWVAKSDGTEPRQLTKEQRGRVMSPAWMPDSQYVLVSRTGPGGLDVWMYHIQGGSGVVVARARPQGAPPTQQGRSLAGTVASPDGKYVYFTSRTGGFQYNMMGFPWQIVRRDMKTGDEDTITQAQGGAIRPLLSPDGEWMVYGTRYETQTGLRIRNLSSGDDRWLKYPVQRDDQESAFTRDLLPGYAFLPDGKEIVLTYGGKIHRLSVASGEAKPIPFTANVKLELGPHLDRPRRVEEGPVRARLIQDPKQSPDGKRVVFSVLTKLYVMDLPGGKPRRLTTGDAREYKPVWSPDGQRIAYVTWTAEGGHVWTVRADGAGAPQQLTRVPAFYTDIAFSPDGRRIVGLRSSRYLRTQTPSEFGGLRVPLDLIWLPAEGGEVALVVPARGIGSPHFVTAEPDRIYVYSRQGLTSLRYDGTDRRVHVRVTGKLIPPATEPPPAQDVLMHPGGQWALAKVNNQLHVLAVPPVGGETPAVNVFSASVPSQQITDIGVDYFAWTDGGKTITWGLGSTFFRRAFDSVSFEPRKEEEKKPEEKKEPEKKEEKKEAKPPRDEEKSVEAFDVVLEFPRHKPAGSILLRGARVVTMKGEEVIENADLVVTDNRIAAVGPRGKVAIPASAKVMDLRGATILPGFVDTHAHYELRTASVPEIHNWSFLANLAYGVTTGLDVQTSTNDYFIYQDLVDIGETIGPRSYLTGPGVFSANDFQSYEAVKSYLVRYRKHYRTDNLKSYVVGNRKQRQWVVQASKELGLMPTTEGALDLKLDMTHAIDGFHGNEHSLPIVPLYKDVVELFARSGTTYTPTLLVLYGGPWAENYFYQTTEVHDDPKLNRFTPHIEIDGKARRRPWFRQDEYSYPRTAAAAAAILRAGGLIGVGAHGQLQGMGYHWEMWALSSGGMTPMEVLRTATLNGAKIIGLAQDVGSIEPGKLADLVVLAKNPLEDLRNTNTIRYVMKNGELFLADTLDQVWPVERKLPHMPWWEAKPPAVTKAGVQ
jgi:Tol biopolymer transport system component